VFERKTNSQQKKSIQLIFYCVFSRLKVFKIVGIYLLLKATRSSYSTFLDDSDTCFLSTAEKETNFTLIKVVEKGRTSRAFFCQLCVSF